MHEYVKVVAGAARIFADEARLVGLVDGHLHVGRLVVEFASNVNVGGSGAHGTASNEAALDELVRIVSHDLAILAGARLAFVSVYDQIFGPTVGRLVHEAPLEAAGKAGAASASQARRFHFIDDPVGSF